MTTDKIDPLVLADAIERRAADYEVRLARYRDNAEFGTDSGYVCLRNEAREFESSRVAEAAACIRALVAERDAALAVLRDWVAARERIDGAGEGDCDDRARRLLAGEGK